MIKWRGVRANYRTLWTDLGNRRRLKQYLVLELIMHGFDNVYYWSQQSWPEKYFAGASDEELGLKPID